MDAFRRRARAERAVPVLRAALERTVAAEADKDALAVHSRTDYLKATVPEMLTYLEEEPKLDSFDPVE